MKKMYISPKNELHEVQSHGCVLNNTSEQYVPVGGSGKFDAKMDNDWSIWEEED